MLCFSSLAMAVPGQGVDMGPVLAAPGALAVSHDGRVAAHVDSSGTVRVWDAATTQALEGLPAGQPPASSIALSADGDLLVIGHADGRVLLWQRGRAAPSREFRGHADRILALDISADGRRLASGSADGTTQLFDLQTGRRLQVLDSLYQGHPSEGTARPVGVAFAAQGRLLPTHDWQRRQYDVGRVTSLWDAESGVELASQAVAPPEGDEAMRSGQAVGGGGWLLAFTGDKQLMLQRLDRCDAPRPAAPAVDAPALAGRYADVVAADPLGRWVATTHGAAASFFAVAGGRPSVQLPLPGRALALAPLADGRSLLAVLDTTAIDGAGRARPSAGAALPQPARLYRISVPTALLGLPTLQVAADARPCAPTQALRQRQQFSSRDGLAPLAVAVRLTPQLSSVPGAVPQPLGPPVQLRFAGPEQLLGLYLDVGDSRAGVNVWSLSTGRTTLARALARQGETAQPLWLGMDWVVYGSDNHLVRATTGQRLLDAPDGRGWLGAEVAADPETGRLYRAAGLSVEQVTADGRRLPPLPVRRSGGREASPPNGPIGGLAARQGRLLVLYRNGDQELFAGTPLASRLFRPAKTPVPADGPEPSVERLMLSSDGQYVQAVIDVSASEVPAVDTAWRLTDGKPVGTGAVLAELPARANRVVTHDTRAHRLAVWDFDRSETIARLPRQRSRNGEGHAVPLVAAISEDGRRVASASPDGLVRVWDVDAHELLGEARVGAAVTALAFDAPGRQLAVGRTGGEVWVLRLP